MKYEGYSCSRENINKVFSAYADCFIKKDKMVKAFHKPKHLKMLEKHKVDKRVIEKILSN